MDQDFTSTPQESLKITNAAYQFLAETSKWTKFLSILGFVAVGLMVVMGLFAGSMFSALGNGYNGLGDVPGALFGGVYIAMGVLYFFPALYLYKFSTNLKTALLSKDDMTLESAFENLKSHYKFVGIMAIVVLGLYALILLGAIMVGGLASM